MKALKTPFCLLMVLLTGCGLLVGMADGLQSDVVTLITQESEASSARIDTHESETPSAENAPAVKADKGFTRDEMVAYILARNPRVFEKLAGIIADAVMHSAEEFSIPPGYIFALMSVESTFRYDAVSSADCIGLMQVNPKHWVGKEEGSDALVKAGVVSSVQDLYDPEINIRAGAYILHHYIDQGKERGVENPVEYGLTRYFGGTSNSHFDKMCKELGRFYVFVQRRVAIG